MKAIKIHMITLLMMFSISCKQQVICSQIKSAEIKFHPMYDVSFQFNRCRVRCFDINKWETVEASLCKELDGYLPQVQSFTENKKTFEGINLPIKECEGIAGFKLEDIAADVRPNIKKLDSIKQDYCK